MRNSTLSLEVNLHGVYLQHFDRKLVIFMKVHKIVLSALRKLILMKLQLIVAMELTGGRDRVSCH